MTSSLYDVLGVDKAATSTDIRKAYRRKAQKLHPDKEDGDKEAFQELVCAYEILVDDHRRKGYDETGSTDSNVDEENRALRELVAILFSIIDKVGDVRYVNIVETVQDVVNGGIAKGEAALVTMAQSIDTRNEIITRLACTGKSNVLASALLADIVTRENTIREMKKNIAVGAELLAILDEYSYTTDDKPTTTSSAWFTGSGFRQYNTTR